MLVCGIFGCELDVKLSVGALEMLAQFSAIKKSNGLLTIASKLKQLRKSGLLGTKISTAEVLVPSASPQDMRPVLGGTSEPIT